MFPCWRQSEVTYEHQNIPLLWIFDVNFDGRQHTRLRAGIHRAKNTETYYLNGLFDLGEIIIY